MPQIDGEQISYVGEVNEEQKKMLLAKAKALLMPIEWEEPFGIVMIEAMACGTPVIGFRRGAVGEVVVNGKTGIVVDNVEDMKFSVINELNGINRKTCREESQAHFDIGKIAQAYIQLVN